MSVGIACGAIFFSAMSCQQEPRPRGPARQEGQRGVAHAVGVRQAGAEELQHGDADVIRGVALERIQRLGADGTELGFARRAEQGLRRAGLLDLAEDADAVEARLAVRLVIDDERECVFDRGRVAQAKAERKFRLGVAALPRGEDGLAEFRRDVADGSSGEALLEADQEFARFLVGGVEEFGAGEEVVLAPGHRPALHDAFEDESRRR